MKNKLILFSGLCALSACFVFPACGVFEDTPEHVFEEHGATASTCLERGHELYYSCTDCDKIFDKDHKEIESIPYIDLGSHNWVEVAQSEYAKDPATCEDNETYYKSCSVCLVKGTESFEKANSALGHAMKEEWDADVTSHWHSCTNVGCDYVENVGAHVDNEENTSCQICGKEYAVVSWTGFENKTYNGTTFTLPVAKVTIGGVETPLEVVEKDGKEFKNAGTYTFVASSSNSEWIMRGEEKTVTVEKASLTLSGLDTKLSALTTAQTLKCDGVMPESDIVEALALAGIDKDKVSIDLTYSTSEDGTYRSLSEIGSLSAITETYWVKASITETDNYSSAETKASVKVFHAPTWDKTGATKDVKSCKCGDQSQYEEFVKVLTAGTERQDVVVGNDAKISLPGVSAYDSIVSIKCGTTSLGDSISALNIPAPSATFAHGEKDLTVVVTTADGEEHTVSKVPVLLITKVLTSAQELKEAVSMIKLPGESAFPTARGIGAYYVLGNDITSTTWTYTIAGVTKNLFHSSITEVGADLGFLGTLDGRGHTIDGGSTVDTTHGLFGGLGQGSVVKNINFTGVIYDGVEYHCILATKIYGATIENVNVTLASCGPKVEAHNVGLLACTVTGGNSVFKNVTIHAECGEIYTALGSYGNTGTSSFSNVKLYAKSFTKISALYPVSTTNDGSFKFIDTDEISVGAGLKAERKIIDLSTSPTICSIDGIDGLGELDYVVYNGKIINDGYAFANGTLTLPLPEKVGEYTCVLVDKNGKAATVEFVVATKILTSALEIKQYCAQIFDSGSATAVTTFKGKDCYYVLGNDIDNPTWVYAKTGATVSIYHSTAAGDTSLNSFASLKAGTVGFVGTFDGNGYSIKGGTSEGSTWGIFGNLGSGAVVKNLNIENLKYTGKANEQIFACSMVGATLENINISLTSDSSSVSGANPGGLLAGRWWYYSTLRNVTIHAENVALDSLLGVGASCDKGDATYENVTVYAKSLDKVHGQTASLGWPKSGFTLIVG